MTSAFSEIRDDEDLLDVTLVCPDGGMLRAHKLMLSNVQGKGVSLCTKTSVQKLPHEITARPLKPMVVPVFILPKGKAYYRIYLQCKLQVLYVTISVILLDCIRLLHYNNQAYL